MSGKSGYTTKAALKICECISSGGSLRQAAQKQGIKESTARLWRRENPEFDAQYARAIEDRASVFFERGNDIAMAISSPEEAQVARVQLDWLKWSAARLGPKQYGDKVEQFISGPGGGPIQASISVEFVKPKTT